MVVFGYRVWPLLKRTWQEVMEDNILGLSAQTAYYFFFLSSRSSSSSRHF
jgi:uncharacterized BrkB/YihY/UPF0761 family membrane protein